MAAGAAAGCRVASEHRYDAGTEEGLAAGAAALRAHGYCVLTGAVSLAACAEARELLWEWLAGLGTGLRRGDPASWGAPAWPPGIARTGILPWFGIGQSALLWHVRRQPRVRAAFARVWGTGDLITSFDGAAVWRPWGRAGCGEWRSERGWWHIDQRLSDPDFRCVQGLVSIAAPPSRAVGGNVLIPGSHLTSAAELRTAGAKQGYASSEAGAGGEGAEEEDFVSVPEGHPLLRRARIRPDVREGDLLLWDSRTVHCSEPAASPDACAGRELLRIAAFVCMVPRASAPADVLRRRRAGAAAGATTTHSPHKYQPSDEYDAWRALRREAGGAVRWAAPPPPRLRDGDWALVDGGTAAAGAVPGPARL